MDLAEISYRLRGWRVLAHERIGGRDVYAVERGGERVLYYDQVVHSRLFKGSIYTKNVWDYFLPLPAMYSKPSVLVIGLGGGTIPYQMKKLYGDGVSVDVVEVDRRMLSLSRAFLPERVNFNVLVDDGYLYISRKKGAYDIIISDPYVGDTIPDPFFNIEFVKNAYDALKDAGVLAINYSLAPHLSIRRRVLLTRLQSLFKVHSLEYPRSSFNEIMICSKKYETEEMNARIRKNFPRSEENKFLLSGFS